MEAEEKRDIVLILKINKAYNLRNTEDAKEIYAYIRKEKPFKSKLGEVFQNRVRVLAKGESSGFTCLFCRKGNAPDGVICPRCAEKVYG